MFDGQLVLKNIIKKLTDTAPLLLLLQYWNRQHSVVYRMRNSTRPYYYFIIAFFKNPSKFTTYWKTLVLCTPWSFVIVSALWLNFDVITETNAHRVDSRRSYNPCFSHHNSYRITSIAPCTVKGSSYCRKLNHCLCTLKLSLHLNGTVAFVSIYVEKRICYVDRLGCKFSYLEDYQSVLVIWNYSPNS